MRRPSFELLSAEPAKWAAIREEMEAARTKDPASFGPAQRQKIIALMVVAEDSLAVLVRIRKDIEQLLASERKS